MHITHTNWKIDRAPQEKKLCHQFFQLKKVRYIKVQGIRCKITKYWHPFILNLNHKQYLIETYYLVYIRLG